MSSRALQFRRKKVTVADETQVSGGFTVEPWVIFQGARFPAAASSANVGIALSIDGGTSYDPILDPADGADAIILASGSDPGWIDYSDFLRFVPQNKRYLLRFTFDANQSAGPYNIDIIQRG